MSEEKVFESVRTNESITISEKAVEEIKAIRIKSNVPETRFLRIGVKGGGCSGYEYVLGFDGVETPRDRALEIKGMKVVIDEKSLFLISGTALDFTEGLQGRGFVFKNPNAVKACGCGQSFGV